MPAEANPRLLAPIDFATPFWADLRTEILDQDPDLPAAQVTIRCLERWKTVIEAWDAQEKGKADAAAAQRAEREEAEEEERAKAKEEKEKERKKKFVEITDKFNGTNILLPKPASAARTKLESMQFVELYRFTIAGCKEAQRQRLASSTTYTFEQTATGLALQTQADAIAAKTVIPDRDLSWEQMQEGLFAMVRMTREVNWDQAYIDMFYEFYQLINTSPLRYVENGQRVLVLYQAAIREEWYNHYATNKEAFDLRIWNDALIEDIRALVRDEVAAEVLSAKVAALERSYQFTSLHKEVADLKTILLGKRGRESGEVDPTTDNRRRQRPRRDLPQSTPRGQQQRRGRNGLASETFQPKSTCAVCLGNHKHEVRKCQASSLWSGEPAIVTRDGRGRIFDKSGRELCIDWQCRRGCSSRSKSHVHSCSGCGEESHGAQNCPLAQKD